MRSRRQLLAMLAPGLLAIGCAAATDPAATAEAEAGQAVLALSQGGRIGGVAVTPLRIEEDSRCPTGVQCIQAGTVRVAVRLEERGGERETVLTLGQPVGLADGRALSLAAVCPYPRHPGTIARAAYRFHFALGSDGTAPAEPSCAP